ncbi:hypothetical protein DR64_3190 [Paraburkholderia xenovorans LB400]|uniref:Uncharacterized protein n=1 Tax=Paraburkholderia xenovorans (strain LB400) TaxID=266265 RepID=Q13VH0_PARXL|nr:hypothetical protein [Paraburkholderia xenovorans]ABE31919.1 Hypothetical protein Bxe_A1028 [Paraburkholderia xenovorans LB400]AIP31122.1 hypothetical protein DR64_3190 [Paraburkholderia xenovorans LB400]
MRPVFRIDLSRIAPYAALCTAIALTMLPIGANAQQAEAAQSATLAESSDAGSATSRDATIATDAASDTNAPAAAAFRRLAANALNLPADGTSMNDFSLDDQALSRQRGGAVGMVMVAATPQLMRGNGGGGSVTLWDEIAPPPPLPIPVDAARAAQGNVASYQRK